MAVVIGHSQTKYLSQYLSEGYEVFAYPGYRTRQFLQESILYEVLPFFSVVVVVVGANDIGTRSTRQIVSDIQLLCDSIHETSPGASVYVSEVLPRSQNMFPQSRLDEDFLVRWNRDACSVNHQLRALCKSVSWMDIVEHPEFFTSHGINRRFLSRDGLHLSFEGHEMLSVNIERIVKREVAFDTKTQLSTSPKQNKHTDPLPIRPASLHENTSCTRPATYAQIAALLEKPMPSTKPASPTTQLGSKKTSSKPEPPSAHFGSKKASSKPEPPSAQLGSKKTSTKPASPSAHPGSKKTSTKPEPPSAQLGSKKTSTKPASPSAHPGSKKTSTKPEPPFAQLGSKKTSTKPASPSAHPGTKKTSTKPDPPSAHFGSKKTSMMPEPPLAHFGSKKASSKPEPPSAHIGSKNSSSKPSPPSTNPVSKKMSTTIEYVLLETSSMYYLKPLVGGGKEVPVFSTTDRVITPDEAADILIQNLPDSIAHEPPYKPLGGTIYVFDDGGSELNKENWRSDGYTWRNCGKKIYQTHCGKHIERTFFKIKNGKSDSNDFKKQTFRFINDDYNNRTVLIYIGDNTVYAGLPHGNRKKNYREHKRTKPSLIKEIKSKCLGDNPKCLHDKIMSDVSPDSKIQGINVPRNEKQIENFKCRVRNDNKLSHDALYALHLLVGQLDSYILSIKTTPDLEVIVGNKELFEELNRLLQLKELDIEIFYDTTFNLGDFYVSTVTIQHPMFKERPVIPIAFMLHERKFQSCHEHFIEILKQKIPKLGEKNVSVVTDREKGIINAFEEKLKNCQVLICWNHILNDVKFWVNKHGGNTDDKKVYESNIKELLQSENLTEFQNKYSSLKALWSQSFVTYFEENLYKTITDYAARWILEEKELYNPYSGITNNVSESLNAKLKRLLTYKERAIDEVVLYLYYLQGNDLASLIRALCGESEWTLKNSYLFAKLDPSTVQLPKNVCHPDKLIQLIKGEISAILKKETNSDSNKETDPDTNNSDNANESASKPKCSSQRSLALKVVSENNIVLVPQMGAFMVNGTNNTKYSVTLFPKEKCTCASVTRCYHIIAAMLSIGMDIPGEKKVYNLTQLRRNCRPKHAKKCGTKRGRKGDNDNDITVIAAPDSVMKSEKPCSPISTKKQVLTSTPIDTAKKNLFEFTTPRSILKNKTSVRKPTEKKRKLTFKDDSPIKILKIESSPIDACLSDDDLMRFDISRDECDLEEEKNDLWLANLGLFTADKNDLVNNKKLNSNHMEAAQKLLRAQFVNSVAGLQLTEKVPVFNDKENRWVMKLPFDSVASPSCQIHHTHHDHWVASIQYQGSVYLLDTLGTDRQNDRIIPDGLKIQLSQMYGGDSTHLKVQIPPVIRQDNSVDCGLYAIAFVTSFCVRKKLCHSLIFDSSKLRSHLYQCFSKGTMSEFPVTGKTIGQRRTKSVKFITIQNYCICNLPECVDNMVQCDQCSVWYHRHCVDAPKDVSNIDKEFVCTFCK